VLPTRSITLVGEGPVLLASELGDGHYSYVLPAAYFTVDDSLHAYFVGFGEDRGDQAVFHAVSGDGVEWTVDTEDPMRSLGTEFDPPGALPGSVLQTPDGYVMYFWGTTTTSQDDSSIWRATSTKPGGPWVADSAPVLPVGELGSWDDGGLDFPAVTAMADGYSLVYSANGGTSPNNSRIGLATSIDGITWTRRDEPVLTVGVCPFDAQYVAAPRLTATDDGYLVLYNVERTVGATTSSDLLAWQCASGEPLLSGNDVPNGQGIHTFATTNVGSRLSVLIESLVDGASEIWLGDLEDFAAL
jgi:hypothetical protein